MKVLLVSLLVLFLGACGLAPIGLTNDPPGTGPTASTNPLPDDPTSSSADQLHKLGDTVTYENGLQLTVSKPQSYTPSDTAAYDKSFHKFIVMEVTVKNGSTSTYDPSLFSETGSTGDDEADEVYDSENDIGGSPNTKILPGKSRHWKIAFGVNKGADFVLEASPDFDLDSVIFTS